MKKVLIHEKQQSYMKSIIYNLKTIVEKIKLSKYNIKISTTTMKTTIQPKNIIYIQQTKMLNAT